MINPGPSCKNLFQVMGLFRLKNVFCNGRSIEKIRLLIAFTLSISILSCTNSMKEINDVTGKTQPQQDVGKNVTILYSKAAKVQARLFTHEFLLNTAANPPYIDMKGGLKAEFFDDSGAIKNTLTAGYGRY